MTSLDRAIRKELVGLGVLAALQIIGIAVGCAMAIVAAAGCWIAFMGALALLYGNADLWPYWETALMIGGGLALTPVLGAALLWSAHEIGQRRKAISPEFKARPSILGLLQIVVPSTLYAFAVFAFFTHSS